jgi:cytochrome c oxidase subunit 3
LADPVNLAVREQFRDAQQQMETSTIGMWIFLITEVMLFGGLFTAFTVYRISFPQAFHQGSAEMEFWMGALNTAVLICSSLTMAMAVYSAEIGKQLHVALYLFLTMVIGLVFLAIKFTEYYLHYLHHKVPAYSFSASGPDAGHVQMFFVFYFIMTLLHATHMFIGEGLLTVMLIRTLKGSFSESYHTPIDLTGLYWHFVDTVWVFLFAIFYIPGVHP